MSWPFLCDDDDYYIDSRGWKQISDRAYDDLDEAKTKFHEFVKQHSFDNITDPQYQFTKKQVVDIHLAELVLRKFNVYVRSFGAKPTWRQISVAQKSQDARYKKSVRSIKFCDIILDRAVRENLMELGSPDVFKRENYVAEKALFMFLRNRGISEQNAAGWVMAKVVHVQTKQKKNIWIRSKKRKPRRIAALTAADYLAGRLPHFAPTVYVEKTDEFAKDPPEQQMKTRKITPLHLQRDRKRKRTDSKSKRRTFKRQRS